jgi:hypothetical protein
MFQIKFAEKLKAHILCSVTSFRKSCRLWDNVEKMWWSQGGRKWQYGSPLHVRLVRLHEYKHTPAPVHPQWHGNSRFMNAPQCYVIHIYSAFLFRSSLSPRSYILFSVAVGRFVGSIMPNAECLSPAPRVLPHFTACNAACVRPSVRISLVVFFITALGIYKSMLTK